MHGIVKKFNGMKSAAMRNKTTGWYRLSGIENADLFFRFIVLVLLIPVCVGASEKDELIRGSQRQVEQAEETSGHKTQDSSKIITSEKRYRVVKCFGLVPLRPDFDSIQSQCKPKGGRVLWRSGILTADVLRDTP